MLVEERSEKRREHRRKHESNRREHKEQKRPRLVVSLLHRFWFELVALGLLSVGLFLLLERLQIKAIIYRELMQWARAVGSVVSAFWGLLAGIETSDLVGIALILVGTGMVAYRLRGRAIHRHQDLPPEKVCPECDRDLDRMHRGLIDRLVELVLHVDIRRYSCGKCSFRVSVWKLRGESE